MYTATEPLYLNKAGEVVKAKDPTRVTLLISTGGTLTDEQAARYGLTNDPDPVPAAPVVKAVTVPPATKAVTSPEHVK